MAAVRSRTMVVIWYFIVLIWLGFGSLVSIACSTCEVLCVLIQTRVNTSSNANEESSLYKMREGAEITVSSPERWHRTYQILMLKRKSFW